MNSIMVISDATNMTGGTGNQKSGNGIASETA